MSELVESVLTLYDGGTFIKKGLVEKEIDSCRLFWSNWLEIDMRPRRSESEIYLLPALSLSASLGCLMKTYH